MLLTLVCSSLTAKPPRGSVPSRSRGTTVSNWVPLSRLFPGHVRRHVVEHEVAENVGNEVDLGVARVDGELSVAVGALLLQRRDVDDVSVVFVVD